MKHPRLSAIVLVAGSILPILLGRGLRGCFIYSNGQCFQAYDETFGIVLLIIGGLLIVGALLALTSALVTRRPRARSESEPRIHPPSRRDREPFRYWAFALFAAATMATAMGFILPWWQVRGTDGSSSTLYYDRWCSTPNSVWLGGPPCSPYQASPFLQLPGDVVLGFLFLQILVAVGTVFLAIGTVGLALRRIRSRAPRLIAALSFLGPLLTSLAVADAFITLPGLEPFLLEPASGFSGGNIRGLDYFAWGPTTAWYLSFLAAGIGWLGLISKRAAFRSSAGSTTDDVRPGPH